MIGGSGKGIGNGRGGRRRRSWRPPPNSTHIGIPLTPSLGPAGSSGRTSGWSTDPTAHIVTYQPMCGAPGCDLPAMVWSRCKACRRDFARCGEHVSPDGREVRVERAEHQCKAPSAPVISLAYERAKRRT